MATEPEWPDAWTVDFPVLWVAIDWEERHCVVSNPEGGVLRDDDGNPIPFVEYPQQLWCSINWYRIKPEAERGQLNTAFFYRRLLYVGPQKCGKGPWMAKKIKGQAAGPVLFDGWAAGGETYTCADHGCPCGWVYTYEVGEPMGKPWGKPLIQLTATSEEQTDNVYTPLKAMLQYGPDAELYTVGEEFTRLPNGGLIETVTSSAMSRLGNPIIFAAHDETGTWTDQNKLRKVASAQRRGATAMGGRVIETTNPWDPGEDSVAQRTWEAKAPDVFKFWLDPTKNPALRRPDGKFFSLANKRERRKILEYVYQGIAHVDLAGIEADIVEFIENDRAEMERFYGNMVSAGVGHYMSPEAWAGRIALVEVRLRTQVVGGFDGSDTDDWTGFRLQTREGHQFTPTFDDGRPMIWDPAAFGGQVPRLEVNAGMAHIANSFDLVRFYPDPPYWESEIDAWAEEYGEKIVIRWYTKRVTQMHAAAERLLTDVAKVDSGFTHDGCPITERHIVAAVKSPRTQNRYVLAKPGDGRKIDQTIPSILANEAWGDVTAGKLWRKRYYAYSA